MNWLASLTPAQLWLAVILCLLMLIAAWIGLGLGSWLTVRAWRRWRTRRAEWRALPSNYCPLCELDFARWLHER